MTPTFTRNTAPLLWSTILGAASIFGSYAFACVFPFAALATIAALTLPMRKGVALVAAVWAVNQVVGFAFRGYPHEVDTVAWGVAIGGAAIAALIAAKVVLNGSRAVIAPRTAAALIAAFLSYEALLYAFALVDGGLDTFTPDIVAKIALNDLTWFASLAALRLALTRAAPNAFEGDPAIA